jgi:hypothetical protein
MIQSNEPEFLTTDGLPKPASIWVPQVDEPLCGMRSVPEWPTRAGVANRMDPEL